MATQTPLWQVEPLGQWTRPVTQPRVSSARFRASWDDTLGLLLAEVTLLAPTGAVAVRLDVTDGEIRCDGMLRANARVDFPGRRSNAAPRHRRRPGDVGAARRGPTADGDRGAAVSTYRIFRYRLAVTDCPEVAMPAGAPDLLDMWALVDPVAPLVPRPFRRTAAGSSAPCPCSTAG